MFDQIAKEIVSEIEGASYEQHKTASGAKSPRTKFIEAINDQMELYKDRHYKREVPGKKHPVSPNSWFQREGGKVRIQPRYGNARLDTHNEVVVPEDKVIPFFEKLKETAENGTLDSLLKQKAAETRQKASARTR
ncbi:MAG: hypothetical protein U5L06_11210 [Rhodovibrio sp.]|nr:hypothetical protein [Rhodovibrio sp.]